MGGAGLGAAQPFTPMGGTGAEINLNTVSFEQLRAEGLSVTQATRLLAHRERVGNFKTVDELDQVPGFQQDFLQVLKSRSTT
jgi:competence ComEA-like helix-hairpin-helix protein